MGMASTMGTHGRLMESIYTGAPDHTLVSSENSSELLIHPQQQI